MPPTWPFRHTIKVAWADLDAAGHVNNARYFSYMEEARVEWYFAVRGGRQATDLDIILARASCDYRAPAKLHDVLVVEVRPGRLGQSSFVLHYTLRDEATGALVAEGESTLVCYDYAKNQKKPVPDELRRVLASAPPPSV